MFATADINYDVVGMLGVFLGDMHWSFYVSIYIFYWNSLIILKLIKNKLNSYKLKSLKNLLYSF